MAAWICPCCCLQRRMLRSSLPFQQGDWKAIRETWYSGTLFFVFIFFFLRGVPWLVAWFSELPGHSCHALSCDWWNFFCIFLPLYFLFFTFYFFSAQKKGELKPRFPLSTPLAPLRRLTRRKLSVTSLKLESNEEAPANEETLFSKNCF